MHLISCTKSYWDDKQLLVRIRTKGREENMTQSGLLVKETHYLSIKIGNTLQRKKRFNLTALDSYSLSLKAIRYHFV